MRYTNQRLSYFTFLRADNLPDQSLKPYKLCLPVM